MEPIVGPLLKTYSIQFGDVHQSRWKQRPPYDRPLAYSYAKFYGRRLDTYYNSWSGADYSNYSKEATFAISAHPDYYRLVTDATNVAYGRLKGELGSTAGWSENLAQIQKTRQMVSGRLIQLGAVVLAIHKKKFKIAAKLLRQPVPSRASHRKATSQNILEFEYGIKPLINDIQESLKFLTSDFPVLPRYIKGTGKNQIQNLSRTQVSQPNYFSKTERKTVGEIRVQCRTGYFVSNPNAFLANQLGLIDTALPWKLIPFSFVVDWFVNVEQVLSSMTDFYGVTLVHPNWTVFARGTENFSSYAQEWARPYFAVGTVKTEKLSVEVGRQLGLPSPVPVVRPFKGWSLERGIQAISLVLSVLGK